MIRTSEAPVPWPVPWNDKQQFFFRPGDVVERGEFECELAADYRAGRVYPFQLEVAFAAGIKALLPERPDDAAAILDWQAQEAAGEELAPDEAAALAKAREEVGLHWPPYAALLKQIERRKGMVPIAAFRRYCSGWEGEGLPPYEKGLDGLVTLGAMRKLDALYHDAGGLFAYQLQYLTEPSEDDPGDRGNSGRPSKSGEGPKISTSDAPRKGGGSPAKSGSRTRSSRSRSPSSRSSTSGSNASASRPPA